MKKLKEIIKAIMENWLKCEQNIYMPGVYTPWMWFTGRHW